MKRGEVSDVGGKNGGGGEGGTNRQEIYLPDLSS